MEARESLSEFERRWNALLEREASYRNNLENKQSSSKRAKGNDEDPFDCSKLQIPPTSVMVHQVAREYAGKWKQLDERKVVSEQKDPTWYSNHVRLPDQFDYLTQDSPPPEDSPEGDRVVSLDDPTRQVSYERALWNIFASVPMVKDLEGGDHSLRRTEKVMEEIDEVKLRTRMDGHGISRLRKSDRHSVPASTSALKALSVVFECWRKLPLRHATTEPHRAVIEFLGRQTLLDVHRAIVDLSNDTLWDAGNTKNDDSGIFLIEGKLYKNGSVDYTSKIETWLASGGKVPHYEYLGLEDSNIPEVDMASVALEELSIRLGVRYVHIHHGIVECSVYLTDRKISSIEVHYPVVHDIWTPAFPVAVKCDACQLRSAAFATSTTCGITLGHRQLCSLCCQQIGISADDCQDIMTWRGQS